MLSFPFDVLISPPLCHTLFHHPSTESPSVHHPFIHPPFTSASSASHSLFFVSLSLQDHSDHASSSPTSSSAFCYPLNSQEPQPPPPSSAGPQPHAGPASAGELPEHAAVEAAQRAGSDGARPRRALPPVAAGDGAVAKVTKEEEMLWKCCSEMSQLKCDGGGEELNLRATGKTKRQVTLI